MLLLNSRLKLPSKEKLSELPNPSNISSLELRKKVHLFVDLAEVITNPLGLITTNVFLTWSSDYKLVRPLKNAINPRNFINWKSVKVLKWVHHQEPYQHMRDSNHETAATMENLILNTMAHSANLYTNNYILFWKLTQ